MQLDLWFAPVAVTAMTVAALWPVATVDDGPVLCPFRLVTGLPCPACGLTRSWVHLAHGDAGAAFSHHPAGPLLFLAAALVVLASVTALLRRRHLPLPPWTRVAGAVLVLGTAGFGITRLVLVARGEWTGPV